MINFFVWLLLVTNREITIDDNILPYSIYILIILQPFIMPVQKSLVTCFYRIQKILYETTKHNSFKN